MENLEEKKQCHFGSQSSQEGKAGLILTYNLDIQKVTFIKVREKIGSLPGDKALQGKSCDCMSFLLML